MRSDVLCCFDKTHQTTFTQALINWYFSFGRQDLPWQAPYDPYRVWVSEIMLQQTQVKTVIPYFNRFIETFPTLLDLAHAPIDQVLALWSGLGYYSRARHLHQAAQHIEHHHQGIFPQSYHEILALPGVGPSTASALVSLAFECPATILDGNVKRVLSRYFGLYCPLNNAKSEQIFKAHAEYCLSTAYPRAYSQGIMDLGALICTPKSPQCTTCPLKAHCFAYQHDQISDYPVKKQKKIRPTQQAYQLILIHEQDYIYLEKRPNKGIWGGLWSFPIDSNAISNLEKKYMLKNNAPIPFVELDHAFTHFQLLIKSYLSILDHKEDCFIQENGRWFHMDELATIGLSKPTTTLVEQWNAKGKQLAPL